VQKGGNNQNTRQHKQTSGPSLDSIGESYRIYSEADCADASALDWPFACAMDLLKLPIDTAIAEFLRFVGNVSGADRAWMIEYGQDLLRFRNTHEWCRVETTSYLEELQETPTTLIAWLHRYLAAGSAVAVNNVHNLPRAARAIQVEFIRQGNKSILSIPIFHNERLRGIIGFDTTHEYQNWSGSEVKAMFHCARLIAQARYAPRESHMPEPEITDETAALVYLRKRGVVRGVGPETIVGVRSAGNYSEIWLRDGSMVLDSRALGIWMSILPESLFFRVHRTAFVNVLHVSDVDRSKPDKWLIKMRAIQQSWPVSRVYRKPLRERLGV
jgi:hypothetical protein